VDEKVRVRGRGRVKNPKETHMPMLFTSFLYV
jgi:hypothetical protein